jgi:hypothetical protein
MTLQLVCTPLRSDTGSLSSESTEPLTVDRFTDVGRRGWPRYSAEVVGKDE